MVQTEFNNTTGEMHTFRLSAVSRATSVMFLIFAVKSCFFFKKCQNKMCNEWIFDYNCKKKDHPPTNCLVVSRKGLLYPVVTTPWI